MPMSRTISHAEMFRQPSLLCALSVERCDTVVYCMEAQGLVTTFIVAGGSAKRLGGVPKGLFRVGSSTVIERTLAQAPQGPQRINANRPEPYEFLGLPIVGDLLPGRGAPGGVVTALAVAASEWVLVLACDMPRLRGETLGNLLEARGPGLEVICFERGGDLEPLVTLYRRTLLTRWFDALPSNPSLRGLIRAARLKVLSCEDPSELDSFNTPEDVLRLGVRQP